MDSSALEEIRKDIVNKQIRSKTFYDARFQGKWLIIVDGTELDEGNIKKNLSFKAEKYHIMLTNHWY